MDLYLRKVDHPQANNNYRVVLKEDETEVEIGSIGPVRTAEVDMVWHWGIDTVIPMREIESEGHGKDLKDCKAKFKAAWQAFCDQPGWRAEFLEMKRRTRR